MLKEKTSVTSAAAMVETNPISDNVGGVKQFSSTLQHALGEERHFALVDGFAFANRRLAS